MNQIDVIRGRQSVGAATQDDAEFMLEHIDRMEELLDEADQDDYFGTEGWRHRLDIDEDD